MCNDGLVDKGPYEFEVQTMGPLIFKDKFVKGFLQRGQEYNRKIAKARALLGECSQYEFIELSGSSDLINRMFENHEPDPGDYEEYYCAGQKAVADHVNHTLGEKRVHAIVFGMTWFVAEGDWKLELNQSNLQKLQFLSSLSLERRARHKADVDGGYIPCKVHHWRS